MLVNMNTCIIGDLVKLIPYDASHVPKYHNWMQSTELQELTASEPLSLEEEFKMQEAWRQDNDKCTFIILDRSLLSTTNDEISSMVGDTNLFLIDNTESMESVKVAEAEIMIAETSARGKHFGWEAMLLMLRYGCEELNIDKYQVKISLSNVKSISMFSKIGFSKISQSQVFQEVTMEKVVSKEWIKWLVHQTINSKRISINR